jgi:hypothetical protein
MALFREEADRSVTNFTVDSYCGSANSAAATERTPKVTVLMTTVTRRRMSTTKTCASVIVIKNS